MQEQYRFIEKGVRFVILVATLILMSTNRASCLHGAGTISTHETQEDDIDDNLNNSFISGTTGIGPTTTTTMTQGTTTNTKIPFIPKNSVGTSSHEYEYQDPFAKGFQITTRVYTDKNDKLAHFDDNLLEKKKEEKTGNDNSRSPPTLPTSPIILPFFDCGMAGSTTVPVPVSTLTVRHLLGHQSAGSFTTGCGRGQAGVDNTDTHHPQLIIPLTSLEIVLNSDETRIFSPGDVILLEDCLTGGHILQGHEGEDMIVMILTLPHPYHHVGKDRNSLSSILNWKKNPCKTGLGNRGGGFGSRNGGGGSDTILVRLSRSSRRLGLGVIGAALSLPLAYFLGRVAPLELARYAGGGSVVVGGTYAVIKLGEYGFDEWDFWLESLRLQDGSDTTEDNNNDNYNHTHGSKNERE
mmetsp:Transcript_12697/g.14073  ORF Transcript_12697/g.14073 Transcript_12697/m.14073 type:complete len:409 (-) Transcript_12697:378-1604(-)